MSLSNKAQEAPVVLLLQPPLADSQRVMGLIQQALTSLSPNAILKTIDDLYSAFNSSPGLIQDAVVDADVIIGNMEGGNISVYGGLSVARTLNKPILLIAQAGRAVSVPTGLFNTDLLFFSLDESEQFTENFGRKVKGVLELLPAKSHNDSLVINFNFPLPIKVACEQYLLFFAQFLQEVGIKANTDVQHKANSTLFSVIPNEGAEALDKIQRALEVYLDLPTNPGFSQMVLYNEDIKVQQLAANVQHFQGQLTLANATIRAQEAIIRAQEATIEAQGITIQTLSKPKLLTGAVLTESLQYTATEKGVQDKQDFLGGAVSLKKYEGKGFDVNIPHIYRWLKDKLIEEVPIEEKPNHRDMARRNLEKLLEVWPAIKQRAMSVLPEKVDSWMQCAQPLLFTEEMLILAIVAQDTPDTSTQKQIISFLHSALKGDFKVEFAFVGVPSE